MHTLRLLTAFSIALTAAFAQWKPSGSDWPEWRGPQRDGSSLEKDLPSKWSPQGENLLWKLPFGGRSTPVIVGNRLFLQTGSGKDQTLQERIVAIDTDSGKILWEHRVNMYLSDVPKHRIAWASPAADPATGNIYSLTGAGTLYGLTMDGKLLWQRFIGEDFGMVTTHGGRTVSPLIDGDLVIVSGITSAWGDSARASHRFMAFDKKTGVTVWVSSAPGRPFDTTYAVPTIADINGTRLFIAGGGDGAVHALKPQTGEMVWSFPMTKRGVNSGVVLIGNQVIVSHSEENYDSSDMGLVGSIDATARGKFGPEKIKWLNKGVQCGFSSPIVVGNQILQADNGANLLAFDAETGKPTWKFNLGTIQKASPVYGDGKVYIGSENGKFVILKPHADKAEVLDEDQLGTDQAPEAIIASPAISRGRVFLVTMDATYAIGKKKGPALPYKAPGSLAAPAGATPAHLQIVPADVILEPGESVTFHARLFDAEGRFIREEPAQWSLEGLKGTIADGKFQAAADPAGQAGKIKAMAGGLSGAATGRVMQPIPWSEDFTNLKGPPRQWVNATGKFAVRDIEGNKVLVKLADNPFTKRARAYMGVVDSSNYRVEGDIFATEKRRQMGDAGVIAQRYALILFGNHQRLELESWQPETERTIRKPFAWKPNTWYRLKLEVQNLADGKTRARGKAWPVAEAEPADWTVEKVDAIPNREGSPGVYADAPFEVYFDNLKVSKLE
ncbi:MAG: PQQ-binding-like beta-propeller repeat protein [Bryobacteraceae bacterium]